VSYVFLQDGGNYENQQYYGTYNLFFKSTTLNGNPTNCIENYIMAIHGGKKKLKNTKIL
jgi:hypothetical protein